MILKYIRSFCPRNPPINGVPYSRLRNPLLMVHDNSRKAARTQITLPINGLPSALFLNRQIQHHIYLASTFSRTTLHDSISRDTYIKDLKTLTITTLPSLPINMSYMEEVGASQRLNSSFRANLRSRKESSASGFHLNRRVAMPSVARSVVSSKVAESMR